MENSDPHRLWYIYANGKEEGPFKEIELRYRLISGSLNHDSFLYTEGMSDWRKAKDIEALAEIVEESQKTSKNQIVDAFGKIPYSKERMRKVNRSSIFLIVSIIFFAGVITYYFWNPRQVRIAQEVKPVAPSTAEDPFQSKDWAELKNYRARTDIVGSGFVLARDQIDDDFPVLKGAVSPNITSGEIEYRIYPVNGEHLMPLPRVLQGKTSLVNGFFVVGPLSDSGQVLPIGKFRMIARAGQEYLGEVTLQRGHLPEGEELQKEEEMLKAARFDHVQRLKTSFVEQLKELDGIAKEFGELKKIALTVSALPAPSAVSAPAATAAPATDSNSTAFYSRARMALEKFRLLHDNIKNNENASILLGQAGARLQQVVDDAWTPLAPAYAGFPNPDAKYFKAFDVVQLRKDISEVAKNVIAVSADEVARRSEDLLKEEDIKNSLMNQAGGTVR